MQPLRRYTSRYGPLYPLWQHLQVRPRQFLRHWQRRPQESRSSQSGLAPPALTRVTQVAPGVLLASGEQDVTTRAPIAISIPNRRASFLGITATTCRSQASAQWLPTVQRCLSSVSARSPISTSFELSGLKVLTNLSLGQVASRLPRPSHLEPSPSILLGA